MSYAYLKELYISRAN